MEQQKTIIKYFLGNIFEAKCHYTAWKMIYHARSNGVVSQEMAERYVAIQKNYVSYFKITERACLVAFVTIVCHAFDKRSDAMSLSKVDKESYTNFYIDNKVVIDALQKARHNLFAHKSINVNPEDITIPSVDDLDGFFNSLEELYNQLSSKIDNSTAWFDNVDEIKRETELLYMNLDRGETVRKKEIEIEWLWDKDSNKISKKA